MELICRTSNNFKDYISVYAAIVAICSTAFFVFLLPKLLEYFNNLNYRRYKEILDLRKALVDNNRTVDPRINKMIDHYENEFIETRQNRILNPSKFGFYSTGWAMLGFIFTVIIVSLGFSIGIYKVWLFLNVG